MKLLALIKIFAQVSVVVEHSLQT